MDQPAYPATLDITALPALDELLDGLAAPLAAWLPAQRWYAHKADGTPRMEITGWAPLPAGGEELVLWCVLRIATPAGAAIYQVPLVLRPSAAGTAEEPGALVTSLPVPADAAAGAELRVLDALRDPAGREAVVRALETGGTALGPGAALRFVAGGGTLPAAGSRRSRLLSGEQSNTSLIVEDGAATPVILKVFRVLQDGLNPDVELQGALTAAGSTRVPAVLGSGLISAAGLRTHALVAQEFLPGVEDAWRTALTESAAGTDSAAAVRDLGAAVAAVHADLAAELGASPADAGAVAGVLAQMRARLAEVSAAVPQVAAHREALESLLAAAERVEWPPLQRIHGDLHLGQVLAAPGRGWVLLDFEGEPLRPLAERSLPDSPLRDVAGMLRSLDYVRGAVAAEQGKDVSTWTEASRSAFWAGYAERAGLDPEDAALAVLRAAFEADKAVYEALYEARNRPDWLGIPLDALARISASAGGTAR
ncbi:phosphotransferase [Brachybacterium squillarum]|uniref:phosphotransferase n=1 Tax=Brachybacterium squillarum TaxID=661979 RepID=UPI00026293DF|nr:phosphotransferase [Brachybacterium squillarum]